MRLALYQPEIPQNTGTLLRLGACLGWGVDLIEPCGFVLDDARLKRAGMDYLQKVMLRRHPSWQEFRDSYPDHRKILLDTKGSVDYLDFSFQPCDILLLGRESDGVPDSVFQQTNHQLRINLQEGSRSLNVAIAAAMVVGEARRQLRGIE